MTAGMSKSGIIIVAGALFGLMSVPTYATAPTADDPGASAALGTIYFSSILDDAGIGSGSSRGGGFGANPTHGSSAGQGASSRAGNTPASAVAPGNGPGSVAPSPPTGNDRTTDIFGDINPGGPGAGPGGESNGPAAGFPTGPGGGSSSPATNVPGADDLVDSIVPPPQGLPGLAGPYSPDVAIDLPSEAPTVVSSAVILQVPEPASIALLGVGLVALGLLMGRASTATRPKS
jgi:hypothetical protein